VQPVIGFQVAVVHSIELGFTGLLQGAWRMREKSPPPVVGEGLREGGPGGVLHGRRRVSS
jgi:hypothetical protein